MSTRFSTTRSGTVESITLFKYWFGPKYPKESDARFALINELEDNDDFLLYKVYDDYFVTLSEVKFNDRKFAFRVKNLNAPYDNVQEISTIVGFLICRSIGRKFTNLKNNTFLLSTDIIEIFSIDKCVQFNLEIFVDGKMLLHFKPVDKINSSRKLDRKYIEDIEFILRKNELKLNVELEKTKVKLSFDFSIDDDIKRLKNLVVESSVHATFDYHSMSVISHHGFREVMDLLRKKLKDSINSCAIIADSIVCPNFIKIANKFEKIDIKNLVGPDLLIGGNNSCSDQKQSYYDGVYRSVNNMVVLPLVDGIDSVSMFYDLFQAFNKHGENIILLPSQVIDFSDIESVKRFAKSINKAKVFVPVFVAYNIPDTIRNFLMKSGIKFQIYRGTIEQYKLSNFVVKCIEKMGGILNIIRNSDQSKSTYFIGLDLGHSNKMEDNFSNLALTLFSDDGIFIKSFISKNLNRNEALTINTVESIFLEMMNYLKSVDLLKPNKFIIHRDGKLHKNDIENILKYISELFDVHEVDIVEIIKSGVPVLAKYNPLTKQYLNMKSGDVWALHEYKYAIMVTNDQHSNLVLKPIIIKHRYGNTDFNKILRQIYVFTKMYTSNLYYSTRLPATTLKANNIVSTSNKIHQSSYTG